MREAIHTVHSVRQIPQLEKDTSAVMNDIWANAGTSWIKKADSATFSARGWFGLTVFNGQAWLHGGFNNVSSVFD